MLAEQELREHQEAEAVSSTPLPLMTEALPRTDRPPWKPRWQKCAAVPCA